MFALILLFVSSFLAATILPAQSEMMLASLALSGHYNVWLLLMVATSGNVLGALVNWVIGYYVMRFKNKKWFPLTHKQIQHYEKMYYKWGMWSLLLAWVPIIGDPLTVIAGMLRVNIWLFLLLVTIGKAARYGVILAVF